MELYPTESFELLMDCYSPALSQFAILILYFVKQTYVHLVHITVWIVSLIKFYYCVVAGYVTGFF